MAPKVPLRRPGLPPITERARWPMPTVAVFGADALAWAETLASSLGEEGVEAVLLRVELRHQEGFEIETRPGRIDLHTHPDALAGALDDARSRIAPGTITIAHGAAFASAVHADTTVWIRGEASVPSLPPVLRQLAAEADLQLAEPRPGVARALASAIRARSRPGDDEARDL